MIRITVFSFFLVLCSWAFAQSPAYRQTLPNSTVSALTAPADMVIDSRNHVFVIDKKKNAIVHFDALGNEIEVIAEVQTTRGSFKLKNPVCLANHPQGIMIYDADQQHIFLHGPNKGTVWGIPGGEKGQLEDVIDMATDSQGFVYVLQRKRNCIEVFNASGDFVTWIAPSKASFQKAFAIEVSLSDELYVLDQEIHSLFIYNIEGRVVNTHRSIHKKQGVIMGQINDFTILADGTFLLLDDDGGDVLVFDRDGLLRTTIQVSGGEEAYQNPVHIAASAAEDAHLGVVFDNQKSIRLFDVVKYKPNLMAGEKRMVMMPQAIGQWRIKMKDVNRSGDAAMLLADQPGSVAVIDAAGNERWSIKSGLEEPVDIEIDDEGLVHVVDRAAGVIKVFDAKGVLIRTLGKDKNAKLKRPSALVRLPNGSILVSDEKSGDLLEWSKDGVFTKVWIEAERSRLQQPVQMAVDGRGQVYVWDKAQNAIFRTAASGWPMSIKKLQVFEASNDESIGVIGGFQMDDLDHLHVLNVSTAQIEMYRWDLEPVRFFSIGHALQGTYGLKDMTYLAYDATASSVVLGNEKGNNIKSFFYAEIPAVPMQKVRWDMDDAGSIYAFFDASVSQRLTGYALIRTDDTLRTPLFIRNEPKMYISGQAQQQDGPTAYRLVALNKQLSSDPGTPVVDYFGWAMWLEQQALWERVLLAYRSAFVSCDNTKRLEQWMVQRLIAISEKLVQSNEANMAMAFLNLIYEMDARNEKVGALYCKVYQLSFKQSMEFQHLNEITVQMEQAANHPYLKSIVGCAVDSLCLNLLRNGYKWDVNNAILLEKKWSQLTGQVPSDDLMAQLYLQSYRLEKSDIYRSAEAQTRLNEAEKWIESARQKNNGKPSDPSVVLTQLKIYNAQGKYIETERLALAEIATPSKTWSIEQNIELHELLTESYEGQGKYALALLECESILILNPQSLSARLTKAAMLKVTGKLDEALKILEEELQKKPEQASLIMRIGEIYEAKEDWSQAVYQFEKALRIEPENKSYYSALARTYAKQSQFLKAAECGRIAFEHKGKMCEHGRAVGMSLSAIVKLEKQWLDCGLALATDAVSAQKLDWALEALVQLKSKMPQQAAVHFQLGQTLLNKGWHYESANSFYAACKLDPGNSAYTNAHKGVLDLIEQSAKSKSPVGLTEIQTRPLYPALYKNYSNKQLLPLGQLIVSNNTAIPITPTSVTVFIPDFMLQPTSVANPVLMAYSDTPIALHALLDAKVLDNIKSREAHMVVEVRYFHSGSEMSMKESSSINVMGRNAINWQDKMALGAFVTSGHSDLVHIHRLCGQQLMHPSAQGLPASIVKSVQFFAAFQEWQGLQYSADPNTPYAQASTNQAVIDYLQFPTELLTSRAGDCDDFVALYCALMESSGNRSGFIDMPGHVMSAFELEIKPDDLANYGIAPNEVIIKENKAWIPVETTLFGKTDFLEAWKAGAARYYETLQQGQFPELIRMTDAHNKYLPADGLPGQAALQFEIAPGEMKRIDNAFFKVSAKMKREQLIELEQRYIKEPDNVFVKNKYAMVLARTGSLDRAQAILEEALALSPESPVILNNMGNVAYLRKTYADALDRYLQASKLDDGDSQILINICQALLALDRKTEAKVVYDKAVQLDANVNQVYPHLKTKLQ